MDKTKKHIDFDDLTDLLCNTLGQAAPLMQTYLIDPLWNGEMLSKDLQKKYIKNRCKGKKERCKKMQQYVRECNKSSDLINSSARILKDFADINLSPIYTSDEFRHIPSFANLLNHGCDERIKRFLELHG